MTGKQAVVLLTVIKSVKELRMKETQQVLQSWSTMFMQTGTEEKRNGQVIIVRLIIRCWTVDRLVRCSHHRSYFQ